MTSTSSLPLETEFYHEPTQQVVDGTVILAMTGVNPETACSDILRSLRVFPVKDNMGCGLLDNPAPVYQIDGDWAIRINSGEDIPLQEAKLKLEQFIKEWLNLEVERLLGNSSLSLASLWLLASVDDDDAIDTLTYLTDRARSISSILSNIKRARSTQEVKLLLQEFQQCCIKHGNN